MKKRVIIYAFMIVVIMSSCVYAEIEIWTASDLNNIRNNLGETYIQKADIDLSGYSSGLGWEAIGKNDAEFVGSYNGNDYVISNLYINRPLEDEPQGLFGSASFASFNNIKLRNVNITGSDYVGGLVGKNDYGYVKDCSVEAIVTGNDNVAGLIGCNYSCTTKCNYFTGTVNGYSSVGGLIGWNKSSSVEFSYAVGTVNGNGYYDGGLVGRNNGAIIRNCYAVVDVSGSNRVGGLVGWNYSNAKIGKSYSAGVVTSSGILVGGLVGDQIVATTDSSYWDVTLSGQTTSAAGEGRTTDEMTYPHAANTYTGWNFYGTWSDDTSYTINEGYPYLLPTVSIDTPPKVSNDRIAAYPNPFKGNVAIDFMIDKTSTGDLSVYNIRGQKVCTLFNGMIEEKVTSPYTWDGCDSAGKQVGSGIYMIILKTDEVLINKKILMVE